MTTGSARRFFRSRRHPDTVGYATVMTRFTALALAGLPALALAGCATAGPHAVRQAHYLYNQALVQTQDEQLLLNLVRLKYRDTPYFLEVTSLSAQYELSGSAALGVTARERGRDEAAAGAGVAISERPTVTYAPLQGAEFVTQLLSPISLETVMLLPQNGWSIERVLRTTVQSLNGVPNAPSASGPTPASEPPFRRFQDLARRLRHLQVAGELSLVYDVEGGGDEGAERATYTLRFEPGADPADVRAIREALHLPGDGSPGEHTFTARPHQRAGQGELSLATRSLLGVLYYLSQGVDVPPSDVEAGRVTRTLTPSGEPFDWSQVTRDLFRVRVADQAPDGAFVRVRYRDHWFFIPDDDLESKTTFGLLSQLFSLQAGGAHALAPTLTLGLGN